MDLRSTTRRPVELAAQIQVGHRVVDCRLINLSMGGAFVVGPALALPIDSRVMLYVELPMTVGALAAPCSVRWSSPDGCGIQFDGLRAMDAWAIGTFIHRRERSAELALV
jgi:PilZ domain-containing protein